MFSPEKPILTSSTPTGLRNRYNNPKSQSKPPTFSIFDDARLASVGKFRTFFSVVRFMCNNYNIFFKKKPNQIMPMIYGRQDSVETALKGLQV